MKLTIEFTFSCFSFLENCHFPLKKLSLIWLVAIFVCYAFSNEAYAKEDKPFSYSIVSDSEKTVDLTPYIEFFSVDTKMVENDMRLSNEAKSLKFSANKRIFEDQIVWARLNITNNTSKNVKRVLVSKREVYKNSKLIIVKNGIEKDIFWAGYGSIDQSTLSYLNFTDGVINLSPGQTAEISIQVNSEKPFSVGLMLMTIDCYKNFEFFFLIKNLTVGLGAVLLSLFVFAVCYSYKDPTFLWMSGGMFVTGIYTLNFTGILSSIFRYPSPDLYIIFDLLCVSSSTGFLLLAFYKLLDFDKLFDKKNQIFLNGLFIAVFLIPVPSIAFGYDKVVFFATNTSNVLALLLFLFTVIFALFKRPNLLYSFYSTFYFIFFFAAVVHMFSVLDIKVIAGVSFEQIFNAVQFIVLISYYFFGFTIAQKNSTINKRLAQAQLSLQEEKSHSIARLKQLTRKRTKQLSSALEEARHSDRVKRELITVVAHEIRTPVAAIFATARLLRKNFKEGSSSYQVDRLVRGGESLLLLLDNLLKLDKSEVSSLSDKAVEFQVIDILHSAFDIFKNDTISNKVDLFLDVPHAIPIIIGNPENYRQVLYNLIGNALKYTSQGEVRIAVSFIILDKNTLQLTTVISDTGAGIEEEKISRVFEAFYQSDTGIINTGLGLGLAICKKIVDEEKGLINVESEIGVGSKFRFILEYDISELVENNSAASISKKLVDARQVLLVDDNSQNRAIYKKILEEEGFRVVCAETGADAISIAKTHKNINVILLDIQLPDISGFEVAKALRNEMLQSDSNIVILGFTADQASSTRSKCIESGMNEVFTKPLDVGTFKQLIGNSNRISAPSKDFSYGPRELIDKQLVANHIRYIGLSKFRELIGNYHEEWADFATENKHLESGLSRLELAKKIHKFSGASKTLGFHLVGKKCDELEVLLTEGNDKDCEVLFKDLHENFLESYERLQGITSTA